MTELRQMLDQRPDLQPYLFCRGFLVTDRKLDTAAYPFYGNWNETAIQGEYHAYTHKKIKTTVVNSGSRSFFLCGHAFNPFTMEHDEAGVLNRIAEAYGTPAYWDRLAEITAPECSPRITEKSGSIFISRLTLSLWAISAACK